MTLHSISTAIREVLRWVTKQKDKIDGVEGKFHKVTFWSISDAQIASLKISFLPLEPGCQGTLPAISLLLNSFSWEKSSQCWWKGKVSYYLTGVLPPWEKVPPKGLGNILVEPAPASCTGQTEQNSVDSLILVSCWTTPATTYKVNLRKTP